MSDFDYVCDWCGAMFVEKPNECECENLKLVSR